jgi:hypothetical protein
MVVTPHNIKRRREIFKTKRLIYNGYEKSGRRRPSQSAKIENWSAAPKAGRTNRTFKMLWLLRKIFGTIALVWLALWIFALVAFAVAPKRVGAGFLGLIFLNYVGAPASIIWAVLKVISVLKASRTEPPVSLAAWRSPDTPAGTSLSPPKIAPVPETQLAYPAASTPTVPPEVYTYSAPGVPMCPQCGERPAIFHCLTHRQAVCLQCVAKHDQVAECFYVPAFRAPKSDAGQGTG